jgi:hypothetical protein
MLPDHPGSEARQACTDAEQTAQIRNLSRKVVWTWVVAAIGPLLALTGLVFAGLSWKASDGQLAVMKAQLNDARNGAAQARKDTDNVIAAADRQADAMRVVAGANKTMADAAKTSASNSASIAKSTERAVHITQDDLRARMGVSETVEFQLAVDKPLRVVVLSANTGKTPTLNVRTHVEFQTSVQGGAPARIDFAARENLVSVAVVQAGLQQRSPIEIDRLPPEVIANIKEGHIRLLIRTLITYDDIFTPPHDGVGKLRTEHCSVYSPSMDSLFNCDFGNHAD